MAPCSCACTRAGASVNGVSPEPRDQSGRRFRLRDRRARIHAAVLARSPACSRGRPRRSSVSPPQRGIRPAPDRFLPLLEWLHPLARRDQQSLLGTMDPFLAKVSWAVRPCTTPTLPARTAGSWGATCDEIPAIVVVAKQQPRLLYSTHNWGDVSPLQPVPQAPPPISSAPAR